MFKYHNFKFSIRGLFPPVIGTAAVGNGGVNVVTDDPLEPLLGAQSDGGPVHRRHVVTGCVIVTNDHYVLLGCK